LINLQGFRLKTHTTWYSNIYMYHQPSKQKELTKLIMIYTIMTLAVVVIVTFIVFFVLGFRFDKDKGYLEQYALLQFSSTPSGATVTIDGTLINSKTPNKNSISAGKHEITMQREGYETWHKTIEAKAGVLTWLNYALLVPKKLPVEPVVNYKSIYRTLASPEGRSLLVEESSDVPTFSLIDLSSDTIKTTQLTIPANVYSEPSTAGITHTFNIKNWDENGRYVLVEHIYGEKNEWLVLDTQDVVLSKNITRLFNLAIKNISFYGTSGNRFFVLDSDNNIRKLDLSTETISKSLVSNVTSFDVYNESNIITYVGNGKVGTNEKVAGSYREGDDKAYIFRTTASGESLNIATTHYFNENYVVVSEGKKVDILSGSYPITVNDDTTGMKVVASFVLKEDINNLTFSPTGEYILVQSGAYFASYDLFDLDYQTFVSSTIDGSGDVSLLKWLDDNYLWSDRDGNLVIREFDGTNTHKINSVLVGQDATLTHNGRYLYSINKVGTDYQLQRVRMILP
jgi:hypothetical protein